MGALSDLAARVEALTEGDPEIRREAALALGWQWDVSSDADADSGYWYHPATDRVKQGFNPPALDTDLNVVTGEGEARGYRLMSQGAPAGGRCRGGCYGPSNDLASDFTLLATSIAFTECLARLAALLRAVEEKTNG